MAYQALARKYRPQSFDQIRGQDLFVQALKNAIELQRIHHAYLFCGARGVGKTSMARIWAKSLNCEKGPTITPCQKCANCIEITQSRSLDVLEIDGASHTGVDDVRKLREEARYLPNKSKYKIYIIDEVHMLSQSAFNALLKILEEPPSHLLFIFATTEPHKIPLTILSRCLRFDFHRLHIKSLVDHFKNLLQAEKINLSDEALHLVAQASAGSVRDGLSILDQVLSLGNELTEQKIRDVLGLANKNLLMKVIDLLVIKNADELLTQIDQAYHQGLDLKIFTEEVLKLVHYLILIKQADAKLSELTPGDYEALEQLAPKADLNHLLMQFDILHKGAREIGQSDFPLIVAHVLFIKATLVAQLVPLTQLIESQPTSSSTPQKNNHPQTQAPLRTSDIQKKSFINSSQPQIKSANLPKNLEMAPSPNNSTSFKQNWFDLVEKFKAKKPQLAHILAQAQFLDWQDGRVFLCFREDQKLIKEMFLERSEQIDEVMTKDFGLELQLELKELNQTQQTQDNLSYDAIKKKEQADLDARLRKEVESSPQVKNLTKTLGARLTQVVSLETEES